MKKKTFTSKNPVKKFPGKGGWTYVSIDQTYDDLGIKKPRWGLVPARITVGNTSWEKSLLPMGDGTLFVALNKKVQKTEKIAVGDIITVKVQLA